MCLNDHSTPEENSKSVELNFTPISVTTSRSKVKRKLWVIEKTNGTLVRCQKECYEKRESDLNYLQVKAKNRKESCTGVLGMTTDMNFSLVQSKCHSPARFQRGK